MNNKNFKSVILFKNNILIKDLIQLKKTKHLTKERLNRLELALQLNDDAIIDKIFEVDKKHKNGKELHIVTKKAIIFIINKNTKHFITVLFARPNQIKRLYKECSLETPSEILSWAIKWQKDGFNNK